MSVSKFEIRPGQLLKDAFTYTPPLYLPLLAFFLPSFLISLLLLGMTPGATVLISAVNLFGIVPFVTGAAIFYAHQNLTNRGATLPDSMQAAGERFVQLVILTAITATVLIVGLLLFVIPGVYLTVRLSFAFYALMIERRSALNSLSRSWQLTKGHWWKIFSALAILFLAIFIPAVIILAITTIVDPAGVDIGGALVAFLIGPPISVYYVLLFMSFVNLASEPAAEK